MLSILLKFKIPSPRDTYGVTTPPPKSRDDPANYYVTPPPPRWRRFRCGDEYVRIPVMAGLLHMYRAVSGDHREAHSTRAVPP